MRIAIKIVTGVVIVFIVVGTWLVSSVDASASNSAAASRSLYLSNCARCHGADGTADTESGRLYDVPNISGGRLRRKGNARLTRLITKGGGSMPGFGKKLTKNQIASLVAYVRTL